MKRMVLAGVAVAMLSGCGGKDRLIGRPGLQITANSEMPPPGRADLLLQQRSYLVGPLDRVSIDVYGVPDVSRTVQVDASGSLSLPLVGQIDATGKTAQQLAATIEVALARYVRAPKVSVVLEQTSQVVTVDGQVGKPGVYPVNGRMTLIRAVASAEGLNEYANQNHVVVYRRVDGKDWATLYDLRAIRSGLYPDPEIYSNDVVFVGESGGRRAFQLLVQSSALLTAPLVTLLNK